MTEHYTVVEAKGQTISLYRKRITCFPSPVAITPCVGVLAGHDQKIEDVARKL